MVTNEMARTIWKCSTSPSANIFSSRKAKRPATQLKTMVNIERKLILIISAAMTAEYSGYVRKISAALHSATPNPLQLLGSCELRRQLAYLAVHLEGTGNYRKVGCRQSFHPTRPVRWPELDHLDRIGRWSGGGCEQQTSTCARPRPHFNEDVPLCY